MTPNFKLTAVGLLLCIAGAVWYPQLTSAPDAERSSEPGAQGAFESVRPAPTAGELDGALGASSDPGQASTEDLLALARGLRGALSSGAPAFPIAPPVPAARPAGAELGAADEPTDDLAIERFLAGHRLTGTLIGGGDRVALVNGMLVREGDTLAPSGARLLEIERHSARFVLGGRAFLLDLPPFQSVPRSGTTVPDRDADADPILFEGQN